MTAIELLALLNQQGITLSVDGADLRISAPKGSLTDELRDALVRHKAELIELLSADAGGPVLPPIQAIDRDGNLPLSFAQQRLWFLDQLDPGTSLYNIPSAIRLSGAIDKSALQNAMARLAQRHEILQAAFVTVDRKPAMQLADDVHIPLLEHDATTRSEAELQALLTELSNIPFSLTHPPLLRAHLVETGPDEHILLIVVHHIIADGGSLVLLLQELAAEYAHAINNGPDAQPLNRPELQYADYAAWQQEWLSGPELERQLDYWRSSLAGAPPLLEIPADRPRPARPGNTGGWINTVLPRALQQQLQQLARSQSTTLYNVVLAAFQVLLLRWTRQTDVLVGTPVAGRQHAGTEDMLGLFVNSLVLRSELDPQQSFSDLLDQVGQHSIAALSHQDLPFEKLVEELSSQRDTSYSPLFQVMFNFQSRESELVPFAGLAVTPVVVETGTAKFDLSAQVEDRSDGLAVWLEYSKDLFDADTIERMLEHYTVLLEAIAANPQTALLELPLMREQERALVVGEWNQTAADYPKDATLISLFETQVAKTPDATALCFAGEELSYAELNRRANQLGNYLRAQGAGPESLIGIYMERSIEMVVAIYAILKAGGAYVPLDPDYPEQRLQQMLQDADMSLLLTQAHLADRHPEFSAAVTAVVVDRDWTQIAAADDANPEHIAAANNAAYVIFTSGSTGQPKGVLNEHRGIVNRLLWMQQEYQLDSNDCVVQKTPFSFDVSVWEFFWPLLNGARLVIAEAGGHRDSDYLAALIQQHRVTTLHFVPSMLESFLQNPAAPDCRSLKRVICSGEALSNELRARALTLLDAQLHNLYGPTEAAIDVTYWDCAQPSPGSAVPIGRPVANTQIYIVDAAGQPAPIGVPGELWIGGVQVARGYVNQPELTAERFRDDPFNQNNRVYRTGDLARFRPDGVIEFLGRIDFQVKLRGFRIELGEIEAELLAHSSVDQAVVILREDTPGDQRLVAYTTGAAVAEDLRAVLAARLPEYMVPAAFVQLDELPLTANGKLDRGALPAPDWRALTTAEYTAPRSPVETTLAEIWQELLGIDQIGVHDNFFRLGGHSLLGTQLISRIRDTLDKDLPLRALFDQPTIGGIAELLDEQQTAALPKLSSGAADTAPLAPAQQRIWILEQLEPGNSVYNIPWATRLTGVLDRHALQLAVDQLVARHQTLRSRFVVEDGSPVQKIAAHGRVMLNVVDMHDPDEQTLQLQLTRLAKQSFQLDNAPLLRINLLKLNGTEHVLQIVIHHIIADGWSLDVMLRELTTAYRECVEARLVTRPIPAIQYADYARWQIECLSSEPLQASLGYWREHLAGAPAVTDLPLDRPRPPVQSHAGAWHKLELPRELTRELKTLAQQNNASLFMVLLAAFKILLARHTGQLDLVIGTPIAGRQRSEFENLLGLFINTLVVRTDLHDNPDYMEVLQRVKRASLDAFAHQDFPFEKLVEELQPVRDTSYSPIFQVLFSVQNPAATQAEFAGLESAPVLFEFGTAKFDLTLAVEDNGQAVTAYFEYNTDLFDAATIETMALHWHRLLQQVSTAPDTRVAEFELLSTQDRQRLLVDWNATARKVTPLALHELVSAQLADNADGIAVECGDVQLSYAELDTRANQLAHQLISLGAGDESIIGICMDRSTDLLVAVLGVLKSGSAYVPLDPDFPVERLHYMLEDSAAQIVITQEKHLGLTAALGLTTVSLDATDAIAKQAVTAPAIKVAPAQLAYVIYTSGSTGKPKGVAIEHGAAVNFLRSMQRQPGIAASDRLLAVTTLSFDISILELFGPLIAGATTVVATRAIATDGYALGRTLREQQITVMQATPATWRMLLQSGWRGSDSLKILCGGEALELQLAERLLECGREVWNMYGPTETTIWSTCQRILADAPIIDVGRPIDNTSCYIVDANLQPVPVGVAGELVIGGAGVARGYLNRPELTAERFVQDPYSPAEFSSGRLYKTGDLARYRSDGSIQVLGRTDFQVKLRGFRIELGEIEAAIGKLLAETSVVVMLREDSPGDQRLVAYLSGAGSAAMDVDELRTALRAALPDYMVPAAFVTLDEFPLTPNAKVDRKQLPQPEWDFSHAYVAPRTPLEEKLANIWADVLNVEQVGIYADFFDLGGHSLLATRLISRIYDQLDTELSLLTLFNQRNVADLATEIERLAKGAVDQQLVPVSRDIPLPLSFAQQRLWFLDELSPGDPMYNIPWVMSLSGTLNLAAMQIALDKVIARHESLRTTFPSRDGEPVQMIAAALTVPIQTEDLQHASAAQVQQRLTELAQISMNLRTGPLVQFTLLQTAANTHLLSLVIHHIVFDAWSHNILLRELAAFYNAELNGTHVELPELRIEFADYAAWQRDWFGSANYQQQLEFWKNQLGDAPGVLELHTDKPRPPVQTSNGANAFRLLSDGLLDDVRKLSIERGCTLFAVLMAAFNVLMSRYAGQDDIVIGTPIAGRKRTELEDIVGFFLHTLAVRGDLSGNPSFVEFLDRLNRAVLEAFANQELPFETLVEALDPERDTSRSPIFQVMFVLQHVNFDGSMFNELKADPFEFEFGTAKYDIMFFVFEANGQLSVRLEYNTDLFEPATVERMIDHYEVLLHAITRDATQTIGELPLLTAPERQQLLVDWNQTALDYPAGDTMHGLFEQSAARVPDAVALWTEDTSLTYRELNRRANKLARELQRLGVGPEVLVALCTERCAEMIIAMLAIQKAGGAYVPIDPQYPPQRVAHMLSDSSAPVLLTQSVLLGQLPQHQAEIICLDNFDWVTSGDPDSNLDSNPVSGVGEQHLGYTIYTSGSTGMPKGVEIEHRNAVALMQWAAATFSAEEFSGVLASTSICFDLSVFEIFCPLAVGGRIVLVEDALALPGLPESAQVALINTVPSAIAELVRIDGIPESVTTVNLAGEPLSTALVNAIYALGTVAQVNDLYGPSEDTTYSTWTRREANALPTIGRPVANTQAYLLDPFGQPVPIGVAGELWLGGAGVTRGYRNHSELTAEKYVADRFGKRPGGRLFRTADQARYRPDGNLEFIGRLDHQVKLRGFRIELGEIETALASHSAVENTVVMAREDREGDKRLVAYIVAGTAGLEGAELEQWESEQVSQWQDLWQDTYSRDSDVDDLAYDFKGWLSSYDNSAIPEAEMRAWLQTTSERIKACNPNRVIEIGSGTGLIVGQIAPHCTHYLATDFSAESVRALETLAEHNPALSKLEARQCTADNIGSFSAGEFDTVILNSVAQYFPDMDYLLQFVSDAANVVSDKGYIFLGDLRSAALLSAYHTSVQLFQAEADLSLEDLAEQIRQRTEQEEELLIDPAFFAAVQKTNPRISGVRYELKRSTYRNELTRFRYDVVLEVGGQRPSQPAPEHVDWTGAGLNSKQLKARLANCGPGGLLVTSVPDARLQSESLALRELDNPADDTVAGLRARLDKAGKNVIEPEDLYALAEQLCFDIQMTGTQPGELSVLFRPGTEQHYDGILLHVPRPVPWRDYGNDPLHGRLQRSLVPILKDKLRKAVPEYMIPSAFVILDAFPLTPNGKINRKALPAPERKRSEKEIYVAPRTEVEEKLTAIWTDILGIEQIGVHDDFFALGGHSLLATQLISRIRDGLKTELPLMALFNHPTVAGLAEALTGEAATAASAEIPRCDRDEFLPLSFAQQRLWFLSQLEGVSAAYNVPIALELNGPLNLEALQHSVNELVKRHETLRTSIVAAQGKATQVIHRPTPVEIDVQALPAATREVLQAQLEKLAQTPFSLDAKNLLRVHVLQAAKDRHILLLVMHHIVSDGWSIGVLARELAKLYAGHCTAQSVELPDLPIQYVDYAVWQRTWLAGEELQRQLNYWSRQLDGAPTLLQLPTDRPRGAVQTFAGAHINRTFSPELSRRVRELAAAEDSTLFMFLLAAFNALLARYSSSDDIVVGTPIAGRTRTEIEGLIGFFVNTLVMRNDLSDDPDFVDLLHRVKRTTLEAYSHQELPFEKLVEELQPDRDTSHSPVFQVLFVLQENLSDDIEFHKTTVTPLDFELGSAKFDLSLFMVEFPEGLTASIEYNTDLFDAQTIERMLSQLETLLDSIVAKPELPVSQLPLLTGAEQQQVLEQFNATQVATDSIAVHELVERQVARDPQCIALCFESASLSYGELNERANRLAHALIEHGAGPGELVGICANRSIESLVAVLAVLKSGAAYVPIDPNYPAERISYMLADSQAALLLTQTSIDLELPTTQVRKIQLDEFDWTAGNPANPDIQNPPSVYAIYTSGSTGKPKGVELTHAGLSNLIQWQSNQPGLNQPARTLQFASLSFDVSFQELFTTWSQGGTLVLVSETLRRDLPQLAAFIAADKIERVYFPYAALQPLADSVAGNAELSFALADVVVAGEQLRITPAIRQMFARLDNARLHNQYGPSETHVVTALTLTGNPEQWPVLPSIGVPVANTRVYVLDSNQQPVPVGVPGELYLGGAQVARGYIHRSALTREKFLDDRFSDIPDARMYRTGDRVRFLPDGQLEFLGRVDDQVKWRGFRIEPGEIEACITSHPDVKQAVVLLREDLPGNQQLVAYVVTDANQSLDSQRLGDHVQQRLPAYMVPSAFVQLDSIPVTPSGKLQRRALPAPDLSQMQDSAYVAARTPVEVAVAQIWQDILGAPRVGVHDDFFRLGGHSLLATQVVSRVSDVLNISLPLQTLFEKPLLGEFARAVQSASGEPAAAAIVPAERGNSIPLSFAQQRLWFLDQLEPENPAYHLYLPLRLDGPLNVTALQTALHDLAARHETLRTHFAGTADDPVQIIAATADLPLEQITLTDCSDAELEQLLVARERQPFDLSKGPLVRATLFEHGAEHHTLLLVIHHIISDGWSLNVLQRELALSYNARCKDQEPKFGSMPIQYADFAIWQRAWLTGAELERQLSYWREQLGGAPALLDLPLDRPRPDVQSTNGGIAELKINAELAGKLKQLSQAGHATLFMTMLAGLKVLFSRLSGQQDIVIGAPIAGRNRLETEALIGFFINALVMRTDLSGNPDFNAVLKRVRTTTLDAYAHQETPFELLVSELRPDRDTRYSPLFQVAFSVETAAADRVSFTDLETAYAPGDAGTTTHDMVFLLWDIDQQIRGSVRYNTDLFNAATIEQLLQQYVRVLEAVTANPRTPINELKLTTAAELQEMLVTWNQTATDYPSDTTIHWLFEHQAEQTPNHIAVEYGDLELTYADLDEAANQLAHYLIKHKIGRDDRVGLCVERTPMMIVGILGIMKAGAAYVPMDPAYPQERLAYIASDCGARMLLSDGASDTSFAPDDMPVLRMDQAGSIIGDLPTFNPDAACGPDNLAYVIYTSGSTGQPKGVMVEHRGVCNLATAQIKIFQVKPDSRVLQYASFSFDASFSEIAMTLLSGATLVLADRDDLMPGDPVLKVLRDKAITTVTLTPSVLVNTPLAELPALDTIVTAGEACPPSVVSSWGAKYRLVNAYGPTEASVCATAGVCVADGQPPSIGKAIANVQIYLLDEQLQPVPLGATGELCVGGVGVARGYLNRPELTAEKFIADPFSSRTGARLYRTGDLARYRADGSIDYIGRIDQQVKVRGFRIEPGEIEAALVANPDVKEALVVAHATTGSHDSANQQLVAYVVPESAPRELELWPSVAEFYVYDEALYYAMTHDERRNAAYVEAIRQAVPGKVVLDIGTGQDAILSRLCVAEGAAKVYAIELLEESYLKAQATIRRHGLEDKITLIHGNSFEVELPEKVDVCVSELVGAIGGSEGVSKIINDAHRYLKPNGRMIPELSETLIAAVTLPDEFLARPGFSRATANYTQKIFDQVGYPFDLRLCIKGLLYDDIISDTGMFERLDHREQVPLEETTPLNLTISADSRIDGFLVWLTLITAEDCTLIDSLQHEHCWLPVYLPVFDPGVSVKAGDRIDAHVERTLCDNGLNPDFRVFGKLVRQDGPDIEFDYDCFHYKEQYKSSAYYQRLFANDNIPVAQSGAAAISAGSLRDFLKGQLPDHMIPASFVALNQFPLTPNGKIDRQALPAPGTHKLETDSAYAAPSTTTEQLLARVWGELLGVERVGVDDNFFELGGDSILSIQIIARAASKGLHFTPKQLFKHQTIRKLAAAVAGQVAAETLSEQGLVSGPVALTPIQRWFLAADFVDPHHFNQGLLYESAEALDPPILEQALDAVLKHHDSLRLSLTGTKDGWQQHCLETYAHSLIESVDLSTLPEAEQTIEMQRLANKLQTRLNPIKGAMLRALLVKRGAGKTDQLLIVIHHLSVDWVSWPILIEDLTSAYRAITAGADIALPAKTTSFRQWADKLVEHANSPEQIRELAYWKKQDWNSAGRLPVDMSSTDNPEAAVSRVAINLGEQETSAFLTQAPQKYHAQANDLLLSAVALAVTEWTNNPAMLINMEGHGREDLFADVDLSRTTGWFTSLFPALLQPDASRAPGATIKAVKEQLRNIPNRGIGFGLLRYLNESVEARQVMEKLPAPEIGYNYLGQTDQHYASDALLTPAIGPTGAQHSPRAARSHLLDISGSVSDGKLYLTLEYSRNLHHAKTIEQLAANILTHLKHLLQHCQSDTAGGYTPSDFPLAVIGQTELDQLIAATHGVDNIYSLTPLQQGMLFHSEFGDKSDAYFTQFAADLTGPVDAECLRSSWQYIIDTHDVLRSSLHWQGLDNPVQIVHASVPFALNEDNWSDLSDKEIEQHFKQLMQLERDKGFVLDQPNLNRVHLIKTGPEKFRLLWSFHHALLDGWSIPLVLNDLLATYQALSQNRTPVEQTATPFGDYIEWLQDQDMLEAERFWRESLRGFSTPTPLPAVDQVMTLDPESADYAEQHRTLPKELAELVQTVAQNERLTVNTLVQGAWALVLAHYTRSDDILYGATTSGRPATLAGVESMIGQFLNTLPVRVTIDRDASVIDWLRQVQEQQLSMRSYEYAALIDIQSWSDIPRGQQMFESLLAYENYPQMQKVDEPDANDASEQIHLRGDSIAVIERTNYPLTFTAVIRDSITARMIYDTRAYNVETIDQLLQHFANVLESLAAGPQQRLGDIALIDATEQERIRNEWNDTAVAYPTDVTLNGLFELQVARSPEAPALHYEDQQLSYAELNARANQLAHMLRDRGIGAESLVGVCMDRSIEMVVALYGILKAGGAYVPLDPEYPRQRLQHMCADADIALVLCQQHTAAALPDAGQLPVIQLDTEWAAVAAYPTSNPPANTTPANAAYVIFTSGSTGRPKGVVNEHRGICNRLLWMQSEYGLSANDRVLQKTPYSFDVSVWEFFWPLQTGALLVIAKPEGHKDPDYLAALIQEQHITTLHFVPSMLEAFLHSPGAQHCTSIVRTICSGEALSTELQSRYFETMAAELHNLYGPTEAAIDVSYWACDPAAADQPVPIGRPVANTHLYIVDDSGRPVPPGVPGELWIGGVQVARGYINRPELTAEKFIKDPFSDQPGARLYRTGDLAKYRPDGVIEFLGRIDFQIKLRGYRIELGEIETELKALQAVDQAAVLMREDIPGDPRIVAYTVGTATTDAMREWLHTNLPDYMIPSAFVALQKLPLTVSGKLDRNALPPPDWSDAITSQYVAPSTPTEVALAEIWQDLLGVDKIGIHDDFFQLGGHSIIAMKLASRIVTTLQTQVAVGAVFATPTVSGLAAMVEASSGPDSGPGTAGPIQRSSRRGKKRS